MNERSDQLYLAASLYYVQGETMESIARQLKVSRSTVSRLLQEARDQGNIARSADLTASMLLIGITVLLSVVAHGLTAAPLALRHGRSGPRDPSSPDDQTPRDTP